MSRNFFHQLKSLWHADFLSAKDLLRRAFVVSLFFLIIHAAGLREFTSILNGTMGSVEIGWRMSAFLGLLYIFAYLGFVLLVPVLILAAAILVLWKRIFAA